MGNTVNVESVIKEFRKSNDKEWVRVTKIKDAKGEVKVDIRKYYIANDGNEYPTKKGIRLTDKEARELAEVVLTKIK